jgi:nucleotide-binding universal stress UspA family protein
MTPYQVVVGVAGHAGTVRTLAWAIAEAAATGAQLVVVHATGQRRSDAPLVAVGAAASGGFSARGSLGALDTVDRFAAGAVAAARARLGSDAVRIVVDAGPPGDVLLREAGPGDVLVIGGPPRTGWWVRSGTTNQVVPHAPCPVIVVHEPFPTSPSDAPAELRDHVVLALDGPAATLDFGFSYANSHGLPLAAARLDASVPFDATLDPWVRRYPRVPVRRLALSGRPADALRRAAAHAALLVIGAEGSALHPLGITCRSLVATADCPVAVIH